MFLCIYITKARSQFFMLEAQFVVWALALAFARAGSMSAARMAMMAITTSSSIRVKAHLALPVQGTPGDVVCLGAINMFEVLAVGFELPQVVLNEIQLAGGWVPTVDE